MLPGRLRQGHGQASRVALQEARKIRIFLFFILRAVKNVGGFASRLVVACTENPEHGLVTRRPGEIVAGRAGELSSGFEEV